jgi:hypothetical protein
MNRSSSLPSAVSSDLYISDTKFIRQKQPPRAVHTGQAGIIG